MKAFLGMLAAALGAAALLVLCGACDGDAGATDVSRLSAETAVEDDCAVCMLFDLDLQVDDD
jgi:hypothetical protein